MTQNRASESQGDGSNEGWGLSIIPNLVSGFFLYIVSIRICSIPINILFDFPFSRVGDPPILEAFPAMILVSIGMWYFYRKFKLRIFSNSILFAFCTFALVVAVVYLVRYLPSECITESCQLRMTDAGPE